jgi:hypothetical protein
VANVESTTVMGPGIAATAAMSASDKAGLPGVSRKTSCVLPGRTASMISSVRVPSTTVTSIPKRGQWARNRADVAENT